jgi:hypothetical protein
MASSTWNMSKIVCDRCKTEFTYESNNAGTALKNWGQLSGQTKGGGVLPSICSYSSDLCPKCLDDFNAWFKLETTES